jgi:CheY-like chemotaxis protein
MGSRVTQAGPAIEVREKLADKGRGDKGDPGGPEENSEASPPHSDSIGSIPSNRVKVSAAGEPGAQGLASLKGGRRILIVDDEANIADTLALIFKMRRYDVRVAYSAESAIEVIAEWRPDLAVLDVILPAMNGIELAIAIKANYSSCRVMLFSGHANTGMLLEEAARKGHQFEVMAKPVYPDLMLERASELLSKRDDPAYD